MTIWKTFVKTTNSGCLPPASHWPQSTSRVLPNSTLQTSDSSQDHDCFVQQFPLLSQFEQYLWDIYFFLFA
jgi:hypothetical protein